MITTRSTLRSAASNETARRRLLKPSRSIEAHQGALAYRTRLFVLGLIHDPLHQLGRSRRKRARGDVVDRLPHLVHVPDDFRLRTRFRDRFQKLGLARLAAV